MSVQFGKCNFDGKPVDTTDLDQVRPVLASYGPDSEGYICKDNFGILYRAFYTTKESYDEAQPHVLASGAVITWTGRLDNREDLTRQLSEVKPAGRTDLAIAVAAYERWGTNCFAKLIGDWALSIWDPGDRSLILAKDFIGTRHLYYSVENGQATWCTLLDPLVLFAGHSFKLDEEYIAGWLSLFPATHLTPYIGIHSVPPSSFIRLARGAQTIARYWEFDPTKRIRYQTDAEYEEHFRAVFSESVRRRLRSKSPVLAELSGGMDSSSIVCIADEVIARRVAETPRLDTISYYTESEPNWDERPYFARVEAKRGRIGCHIEVGAKDAFRIDFDMSRMAASPSSGSCLSEANQKFAGLVESQGNRVLLSGIGGDEFTGGVPNPVPELADLLLELDFTRLVHQLKVWALEKRKPWLHLLVGASGEFCPYRLGSSRWRNSPCAWLNADFVQRNREAISGYETRWRVFGPRASFQDHMSTLGAMRRQLAADALPSKPAFEKRYPYLDRDLLEFSCAIPPDQLIRPGQRRSLMRRALAFTVPEEVLNRKRKAHVARGLMAAISSDYAGVNALCQEMVSSSIGLIDQNTITDVLLKGRQGLTVPLVPFMRTLAIEWWLRNLVSFGIVQFDRGTENQHTLRVLAQCNQSRLPLARNQNRKEVN